jgi:hypothetical protein
MLPGVDMMGTQGSLRYGYHISLSCLVAKIPHIRADVDELACRLHRPMNYGRQVRT